MSWIIDMIYRGSCGTAYTRRRLPGISWSIRARQLLETPSHTPLTLQALLALLPLLPRELAVVVHAVQAPLSPCVTMVPRVVDCSEVCPRSFFSVAFQEKVLFLRRSCVIICVCVCRTHGLHANHAGKYVDWFIRKSRVVWRGIRLQARKFGGYVLR